MLQKRVIVHSRQFFFPFPLVHAANIIILFILWIIDFGGKISQLIEQIARGCSPRKKEVSRNEIFIGYHVIWYFDVDFQHYPLSIILFISFG